MAAEQKDSVSLSVVWVHFYTPELLVQSVDAVTMQCQQLSILFELIVVDNGGLNNPNTLLSDQVNIISGQGNIGYAAAINLGVNASSGDKILVLNPDVIVQPMCISELIKSLHQNDIVAPYTYLDTSLTFKLPPTEKYDFYTMTIRVLAESFKPIQKWALHRWRKHVHRAWQADLCYELSGAIVGFSRFAWTTIGPWNDTYFLYFEETDWLRRAKQAGLRATYAHGANAVHLYAQSPQHDGVREKHFAQSLSTFEQLYLARWQRRILRLLRRWVHLNRAHPKLKGEAQGSNQVGNINKSIKGHSSPSRLPCLMELSNSPLGFPATIAFIRNDEELKRALSVANEIVEQNFSIEFNYDSTFV